MLLRSLGRAGSRLASMQYSSMRFTATGTAFTGDAGDFLSDNPSLLVEFFARNPAYAYKKAMNLPIKWSNVDWESLPGRAELFHGTGTSSLERTSGADPDERTLFIHDLAAWRSNPGGDEIALSLATIGIHAPPYTPHTVIEVVSSGYYKGGLQSGHNSSATVDIETKKALLPQFEVPLYWLVFDVERKIEVYELEKDPGGNPAKNSYNHVKTVDPSSGTVQLPPFERLRLDLVNLPEPRFDDPNDPYPSVEQRRDSHKKKK
ncbi:hypothetical protein WJX72_011032 [[Myrmecia] bisecta]|uniref:Uncharacterized protein n=1 Tax=[Myrmecia] bisecta TaxID=41462 RepID=A0AAW1RAE6_9CHLO